MDEYYEAWQSPKNKRHAEYGGKSRDEIKARSSIAPVPIRSTASARRAPFLKDFLSRRAFLSAHPSLSIPTHLDTFQLRH